MADFKIGDRVRLNSGGPVMTICDGKSASGKLLCMWFELKHAATPFDAYFHPNTLQKFEEPDVDAIREKLGLSNTN
ncbi:YodC family protein [Aeromonas veronii]|uniref:YodC family protein n=1 Tax=Aeromonas veronii TaxID=654 RepID=UPI00330AB388|nr:DUF2158 domain-containing protein [Aeromonas veronii]